MDHTVELGELLLVTERVIVAPATGTFRPRKGVCLGMRVDIGDTIGEVRGPGTAIPVQSPFRGVIQGVLTLPRERLRRGQAVVWLRAT